MQRRASNASPRLHAFKIGYCPSYRADAAKDGWARMLAWFRTYGV